MILELIIEILEASVSKHGDKPLTTYHLLNILKMAERKLQSESDQSGYSIEDTY